MAEYLQYEADPLNGLNAIGTPEERLSIMAQLRAVANVIPGHVWYATPSGALVFVNSQSADYLELPKDHPLRFGIDFGGAWDSHIPLLHPDDHEETRKVWSTCLRTGTTGEVAFDIRQHRALRNFSTAVCFLIFLLCAFSTFALKGQTPDPSPLNAPQPGVRPPLSPFPRFEDWSFLRDPSLRVDLTTE